MKPITVQKDELFKQITTFNQDKGICGFAASFCYLYSISGLKFLDQIDAAHKEYAADKEYLALVGKLKKEFKDVDHFSLFIAANTFRWTKNQDENIQELKEFALIFSKELDADLKYNTKMGSLDGVATFFTKIGIPLTPGNIKNILQNYLPSESVVTDLISGQSTDLVRFVKENPGLVAIIGLSNDEKADVMIHHGLRHWVFKYAGRIYNHGDIQDAESIAARYSLVCNAIK